ncbi:hypothetical protein TTHERM_000666599 (macronuclear) [Tetrahymena thermophila SB210]|uniref:Uncharacterized protein n=1 Tax=Tetrahymena thermophila (strain SB210) TaxID=312017 RepID=W7XAJ1_TETTS|nr:hypothetical protein TTHERM_000666599 [Tetrahymena thermophila SB210]EWS73423.1 hypothetical protein TTHERM_000666599 [Tetrahymena thermophila SB210]|eukprot:XP_012654039.1 hypothetical protein TTHERM_000666599 [Tetrahymena thermophila SB210]
MRYSNINKKRQALLQIYIKMIEKFMLFQIIDLQSQKIQNRAVANKQASKSSIKSNQSIQTKEERKKIMKKSLENKGNDKERNQIICNFELIYDVFHKRMKINQDECKGKEIIIIILVK